MAHLEDIEAAIRRDQDEAEAKAKKEAAERQAEQEFAKAWERVTDCRIQEVVQEFGRAVTLSEFYAEWARRFCELGSRLVERCWDWRLSELKAEQNSRAYAIELLKLACEKDDQPKIAECMIHIANKFPELHNIRDDLRIVQRELERLEQEQGPPWTLPMSVAELAKALDSYMSQSTIRRRLSAGEWKRRPRWEDKSKREGRYRSKDRAEQREILRRVRDYLAEQERLIPFRTFGQRDKRQR